MKDQINAIYIQSMKITRSLCKKLLMIKSVNNFFFTPSTKFMMQSSSSWKAIRES